MAGREPSEIYLEAATLAQSSAPLDRAKAYRLFASIPGYLDAQERAAELKSYGDRYAELERAEQMQKQVKKARSKKQTGTLITVLVIIGALVGGFFFLRWKVTTDYDKAVALIQEGEYREADNILKFLFSYKESESLREHAQQYLTYFDELKQELEADLSGYERETEIYHQLQMMSNFSEAEALLANFQRQAFGYTKTASDGKVTRYRNGFDDDGNIINITAWKPTDEGEEKVHTETISTDPVEGRTARLFEYESKKISDSAVRAEYTLSDGAYLVEKKTEYEDDPAKYDFYRWFDAAGNQVYGPTDEYEFPKSGSSQTVLVFYHQLDENGRLVRSWQQEVTKKGKIDDEKQKEVTYTYDDRGNLSEEIHYKTTEKKNKVDYRVTYTYDAQGRVTQMVNDGTVTDYTYTELGEQDTITVDKNGKKTQTVYEYGYQYMG